MRDDRLAEPFDDDLLGKVIAWGRDRDQAIGRMRAALDDLEVRGVAATAPAPSPSPGSRPRRFWSG